MKEDFAVHNLFWKSFKEYEKFDPQLGRLKDFPYVYDFPVISGIPIMTPGIYMLTGGRQVGKTTTLKLIIKRLLEENKLLPGQIYYLPCDTIKGYDQLLFEIGQFRQSLKQGQPFALFIDEICYVKEWTRAIKSLADAGFFNYGSVLITGSDTCLLKDAMIGFPGRRGRAKQQDFHLLPLSFFDYVLLKEPQLASSFEKTRTQFQNNLTVSAAQMDFTLFKSLNRHFNDYLFTGGYLLAINDYAKNGAISNVTYRTYIQWIIGDMLKRGKNERYLEEIVKALFLRLSKQVTWHSFTRDLSIEHHQTVVDYMELLSRMDVVIVLQALREDKLRLAPKKAKKISFLDPFIFHALRGWTAKNEAIFNLAAELLNSDSQIKSALIEGVIAALFHRRRELSYIKAEGEVDLALILSNSFFPIEIKNSLTLRKQDLKQILKYPRGLIGYTGSEIGRFEHLQVAPIPLLALLAA